MHIERKNLLDILNKMKSIALGSRGILDVSNTFFFTGQYIIAYNDKSMICIKYITDFTAIIPAKEFYKLISNIQKEKLRIVKEERQLKISGGNIKAGIKLIDSSVFSVEELIKIFPQKWKKLPAEFQTGISLNSFSTSSTSSAVACPEFLCIHVHDNIIESTDNFRISHFEMEKKIEDELLLPYFSVSEMFSTKEKFIEYTIADGWVFFSNGCDCVFGTREILGTFPDTSSFFNIEGEKIIFPDDFIYNLNLVSILAENDYDIDKKIKIKIEDNYIYCTIDQQVGWMETKMKIDTKQKIMFEINPIFLKEILKISKTFIYGNSCILFDADSFKHVISLYEEEK